jgi:O-antigen ligase
MSALTSILAKLLTIGGSVAFVVVIFAFAGTSGRGALLLVAAIGLLASMIWFTGPQKKFLLGLLFLAAPFDISQAIVPPLDRIYSPGLYVTIAQAVMLLLGLLWAAERMLKRHLSMPFTRLDRLGVGFLVLVWFGAMHAQGRVLSFSSAIAYTLCVLGFYVVSHAVETKSDLRLIMTAVIVGLCLEAVYVAAQMLTHNFLTLPGAKVAPVGTQGLVFGNENTASFRPIGSFNHPNALADYLTLLVSPAFALVLMSRRRLPARIWTAALGVLLLGTALLLLTLSRGSWAAALLGGLFIGSVFWRTRIIGKGHLLAFLGLGVAGVLATAIIFPQVVLRLTEPDMRSTESRLVLTDQAVTIIRDHPFIGVGYGGYNLAAHQHTPPSFALISEDYQKQLLELIVHNHYLLVAAELGIPAMCYFIFLMLRFVRQAWPLSRWRDPGMFALGVGLSGALVSQMLFLASDNYYVDIRIFLLWITAGLLQALTIIAARDAPATATDAGHAGAAAAATAASSEMMA